MKPTTLIHHEDDGGRVTTRSDARISAVVVTAYAVIVCGSLIYFFSELHRPAGSEESSLRVLNAGMQASWVMMVGVVTIVVVFALGVLILPLGKSTHR